MDIMDLRVVSYTGCIALLQETPYKNYTMIFWCMMHDSNAFIITTGGKAFMLIIKRNTIPAVVKCNAAVYMKLNIMTASADAAPHIFGMILIFLYCFALTDEAEVERNRMTYNIAGTMRQQNCYLHFY
uniref:Uncharacterized protein n=1 Tax=Glossina brevipalpis TaxID=37001 RepID=A0A1A9X0Q1_9MUSC